MSDHSDNDMQETEGDHGLNVGNEEPSFEEKVVERSPKGRFLKVCQNIEIILVF